MSVQTMLELAEEYLASRRNLGYALMIEGAELVRFARYADRIGHRGPISTQLAVQWSKLPVGADPIYWARRLDIVRRFARYRALFDPATEIPQPGLLGRAYRRPTPYIYSDDEVAALLKAARSLGPAGGLRPHTYETLFGLLACTGLRISEALGLTDQDVNLERGILVVRASKFKKSRLVPLHPSATSALHRYAEHRRRYHPAVKSDAFFLTERATSLKYHKTLMTFLALSTKLGWRSSKCRIHDLSPHFSPPE